MDSVIGEYESGFRQEKKYNRSFYEKFKLKAMKMKRKRMPYLSISSKPMIESKERKYMKPEKNKE